MQEKALVAHIELHKEVKTHITHGKRAMDADATPINTPAGTTVLSSIRLNGSLVYTTYQSGTTAQRFREYTWKTIDTEP